MKTFFSFLAFSMLWVAVLAQGQTPCIELERMFVDIEKPQQPTLQFRCELSYVKLTVLDRFGTIYFEEKQEGYVDMAVVNAAIFDFAKDKEPFSNTFLYLLEYIPKGQQNHQSCTGFLSVGYRCG